MFVKSDLLFCVLFEKVSVDMLLENLTPHGNSPKTDDKIGNTPNSNTSEIYVRAQVCQSTPKKIRWDSFFCRVATCLRKKKGASCWTKPSSKMRLGTLLYSTITGNFLFFNLWINWKLEKFRKKLKYKLSFDATNSGFCVKRSMNEKI